MENKVSRAWNHCSDPSPISWKKFWTTSKWMLLCWLLLLCVSVRQNGIVPVDYSSCLFSTSSSPPTKSPELSHGCQSEASTSAITIIIPGCPLLSHYRLFLILVKQTLYLHCPHRLVDIHSQLLESSCLLSVMTNLFVHFISSGSFVSLPFNLHSYYIY